MSFFTHVDPHLTMTLNPPCSSLALLLVSILLTSLSCSFAIAKPDDDRPNVLVVLVDDFGWGDPSIYGNQRVRTPNIDRMAAEGVRFMQGYVASPICSPSRCGIITGQYPARWNINSYLQTKAGNKACEMVDFLTTDAPSLPRVLQDAGYATAHIGKWHLGGGRDVVDPPRFASYGYKLGLGTYESPEPAAELGLKSLPWAPDHQREPQQVPRHQRTQWMVDQAIRFLKDNSGKPCFINLWLDDTHTPFSPSPEQIAASKTQSTDARNPNYLGVMVELDSQLGRLLNALKSTNTLVLLLGDNGPSPPLERERTGGLRGQKLSLYEGGVRVPMIAWWSRLPTTNVSYPSVNHSTIVSSLDFLPSLATLCKAKLPADYEPDGVDMSRTFLGEELVREKPLFWEYGRNPTSFSYPKEEYHKSPNLAVRKGNWKLLAQWNPIEKEVEQVELYDVMRDPFESENVASMNHHVVDDLSRTLEAWRSSLPAFQP